MKHFEYFLTVQTIVIGLIFTDVLARLAAAFAKGSQYLYWLPLGWCGILLIGLLQWWWALRTWQSIFNSGRFRYFWHFVLIFLGPVLLFFSASFLLPQTADPVSFSSLRASYFHYHFLFGACGCAAMIQFNLVDWVFLYRPKPANLVARFMSAATLLACALTQNRITHYIAFGVNISIIGGFILRETSPLRNGKEVGVTTVYIRESKS